MINFPAAASGMLSVGRVFLLSLMMLGPAAGDRDDATSRTSAVAPERSYEVFGNGIEEESLSAPDEPMPRCFADMDIVSHGDCSRRCIALYSVQYWDVEWVPFQSHLQQSNGCVCRLDGGVEVQICGEPARFGNVRGGSSSYGDSDGGRSGGRSGAQAGAIVAVSIAGVVICLACRASADEQAERRRGRNGTGPSGQEAASPELNDFRHQLQQQQQEEGDTGAAAAVSVEEQRRLRHDLIKSHLFTHQLTEDADAKNLAVIISGVGSNDDNGKDEADFSSKNTATGTASVGILETIRSALSHTVRSTIKPECSICLTEYQGGDTISWSKDDKCGHIFHEECITEWLSTPKRDGFLNDACPLCRSKLVRDQDESQIED